MKNTGIIIADRKPTDFVSGSSPIPFVIRNSSGDWTKYQPTAENQFSGDRVVDSMACVSYSAVHCLESQILFLTGEVVNLSERFLAKMSGTTSQGNYLTVVADAIRKYGMVTDDDWPEPVNFTWNEYYATIPPEVIAKGQDFLKQWNIQYEFVADVAKELQQAPLQVVVEQGNPYHAQELLTPNTVFDTYPPYVKPLKSANDYMKIVLSKKTMGKLVTADNKTVWYLFNGFRFWVLDPNTLNQGENKLWSGSPTPINETDLMAVPYGGAIFISNTDSPTN